MSSKVGEQQKGCLDCRSMTQCWSRLREDLPSFSPSLLPLHLPKSEKLEGEILWKRKKPQKVFNHVGKEREIFNSYTVSAMLQTYLTKILSFPLLNVTL